MMYGKENAKKQKRVAALLLVIVFVLAGTGTAYAAEKGADMLYGNMLDETAYIEYESEEAEENGLEEIVIAPEEAVQLNLFQEGISPLADSTALISTSLKNQRWGSGLFSASAGQEIYVSVSCKPNNVKIKVGIQEPDGYWRLVYAAGDISHHFALTKTGKYVVIVWNETDTTVDITGHYSTDTP